MKIDYCTILTSKNEFPLLSLNLNSMKHYMGNSIQSVKISVPDDLEIIEFCKQFPVEVIVHPTYTQMLNHPGLKQAGFDCANRMDKLVWSCESDYVILSHLDIVWLQNPLGRITPLMNHGYAMMGIWPHGCTVVNRNVYKGCHHGFWPNGGWLGKVVHDDPLMVCLCGNTEGKGLTWWNRDSNHLTSNEKLVNIDGVDVGMLLTMEVQGYGYLFDVCQHEYHHIGGGSYHGLRAVGDEVIKEDINKQIELALKRFKEFG